MIILTKKIFDKHLNEFINCFCDDNSCNCYVTLYDKLIYDLDANKDMKRYNNAYISDLNNELICLQKDYFKERNENLKNKDFLRQLKIDYSEQVKKILSKIIALSKQIKFFCKECEEITLILKRVGKKNLECHVMRYGDYSYEKK